MNHYSNNKCIQVSSSLFSVPWKHSCVTSTYHYFLHMFCLFAHAFISCHTLSSQGALKALTHQPDIKDLWRPTVIFTSHRLCLNKKVVLELAHMFCSCLTGNSFSDQQLAVNCICHSKEERVRGRTSLEARKLGRATNCCEELALQNKGHCWQFRRQ